MPTYVPEHALRPGTVTAIRGIIFQSDGRSTIGRMFIRPFETLDRLIAGVLPEPGEPPLAMHAGIRVLIDDAREYVAEQLVGPLYMDLKNGLNWTPIDEFRRRDRGGWDVTVAARSFRRVDAAVERQAEQRLNAIQGRPFVGEDCTAFIERAFVNRRLFADSPLLRTFGIAMRVGDPALPLLRPDAQLDERARRLLQFDAIKDLPDAIASAEAPNARVWLARLTFAVAIGWACGWIRPPKRPYPWSSRRSMLASLTGLKVLR